MRRVEAGKKVSQCTYLTAADKSVFRTLLERANNDDCKVPPFQTPTIPELTLATSLGRATVFRALDHLERHKWMVRTPGKGRTHKSSYALVVEGPDALCECRKVSQRDPLGPKRSQGETRKVSSLPESSQVKPPFSTRDSRDLEEGGACKVFADGTCSGAATFLSCQLCPKSPTYWRKSA